MRGPRSSNAALRLGGGPRGGGVSQQIFTGASVGGFVDSTKTIASASGNRIAFGPGSTLLVIFHHRGAPTNVQTIVSSYSTTGLHGWELAAHNTAGVTLTSDVTSVNTTAAAIPSQGIVRMAVVWAVGGGVSVSVNGTALASIGTLSAPTITDAAAWASYIGTAPAQLSAARHALANDRVIAAVVLPSVLTSAQASATTYTTGDRFSYASSARSGAVFDFLTSRDYAASSFASQGSSPVTFTVTGALTRYTLAERRLLGPISDSAISEAHTDASGNPITIRSAHARSRWTTKAAHLAFAFDSNMVSSQPARCGVGVYVAGSYSAEFLAATDSLPVIKEAQCGTEGTTRAIDLWDGMGALLDSVTTPVRHGTSVIAVWEPLYLDDGNTSAATAPVAPTRPSKRVVLVGDSIITGFNTSPASQNSPAALMRAAGYNVTCISVGGDAIYYIARGLSGTTVAGIIAACDGTADNVVEIGVGTNDYGAINSSIGAYSAASFQTDLDAFVTALLAAATAAGVPGFVVKFITPIQRIAPATEAANAAGNTLGDYRTAISTVGAAHGITVSDGTTIMLDADIDADGVHPKNTGAAKYATRCESLAGAP